MDKHKSLLLIAGAVLLTGAAYQAKAVQPMGEGCFTSGYCSLGVFGGSCIGTLYNTHAYCACQPWLGGSPFGTNQCNP